MIDLSTNYLGFPLKNPLVVSASPLTENLQNIRKLEDAGAAAVVFHSLFEEQLTFESYRLDRYFSYGTESYAESLSYFPDMSDYNLGPDGYLKQIADAKSAVDIPIIASLNGVTNSGWVRFAEYIQEAGADAIELNLYYIPTNPQLSGEEVEKMYVDVIREIQGSIDIPLAVKLAPYFSSMAHMARKLDDAGVQGLVLFNRFYQPDFDLEELEIVPSLRLSSSDELLLRLTWVAILFGSIHADMAITGGVHKAEDVLKAMMAGANVSMMTSAILKNGIEHISSVLSNLVQWMEEREYESIRQMRGSLSRRFVKDPAAFERANYMKVLSDYSS